MSGERHKSRWRWRNPKLAWLMFAVGMALGILLASRKQSRVELPGAVLNATATHGGETLVLATGPMQDGVEGIFLLDCINGELTCLVVNPSTGSFRHPYTANVATDLQIEPGKQPRYLLVTGAARFRIEGEPEPAESIVYVADANSGSYIAYWMPRQTWKGFYGFPAPIPMIVLHKEIRQ